MKANATNPIDPPPGEGTERGTWRVDAEGAVGARGDGRSRDVPEGEARA